MIRNAMHLEFKVESRRIFWAPYRCQKQILCKDAVDGMLVSGVGWVACTRRAEQPVPRADDESQSAERSRRGRCSPSRSPGSALIWRVVTRLQILCGYTRRRPSGWAQEGCCEERWWWRWTLCWCCFWRRRAYTGVQGSGSFPLMDHHPDPWRPPPPEWPGQPFQRTWCQVLLSNHSTHLW